MSVLRGLALNGSSRVKPYHNQSLNMLTKIQSVHILYTCQNVWGLFQKWRKGHYYAIFCVYTGHLNRFHFSFRNFIVCHHAARYLPLVFHQNTWITRNYNILPRYFLSLFHCALLMQEQAIIYKSFSPLKKK